MIESRVESRLTSAMAMVALRGGGLLTSEGMESSWARLWPDEPPLRTCRDERGALEVTSGSITAFAVEIPAPLPAESVDMGCAISWLWPDARAAVEGHDRHIVVSMPWDGARPLARAFHLSRLLGAAADAADGAAIFWPFAGLLHEPKRFVKIIRKDWDRGAVSAPLWVSVIMSKWGLLRRARVTTQGMRLFGHKEFEVIDSKRSGSELMELVYDCCMYVMEKGPVLNEGDTFGRSGSERLRIEHGRSAFVPELDVIRLHV